MTKAFLLGFIAGASKVAAIDNPYYEDSACFPSDAFSEWQRGYHEGSWLGNPMQDIMTLGGE